ncbi:MAG: heme-binding protein [Amaricoccus sp.]
MLWIGVAAVAVAAVGVAVWGSVASAVEQARYTVVSARGPFEIRDYPGMIVAEVEVAGERRRAISDGFRLLAGYIFGGNRTRTKVAMTAPVTQAAGEKIAMTAPVTQAPAGDRWRVRFVMPAGYTLDTLPVPDDPAVTLKALPAQRFAAIRFAGRATAGALDRQLAALRGFMADEKLAPLGDPVYAFYNPPWTLPFLRRNEIMIEVAR